MTTQKTTFILFFLIAYSFLIRVNSYSQWQTYQLSDTNLFHEVCVVDQNIIWACGQNNKIVKSSDGGIAWSNANYGLPDNSFTHIAAVDMLRAWVVGETGKKIYATTNGGLNWSLQNYNNLGWINKLILFNASTGFFIRDFVLSDSNGYFVTRNGGLNWAASPNSPKVYIVHDNSVGALDTNLIWFVSNQKLYKLANGLNNVWSTDTIGPGINYPSFVLFKNPTTGLATGGYNIAKTTNGGQSWYQVNNTAIGYGCRSFINIPNTDWVFMNGGTSIRISYDFCNTWQTLLNYNSGEQYLSIMDAYDSLSIWLASNKGRLLKYNYGFIGIIKNSNSANSFTLYQNYPNPFNPTTTIRFDIPPLETGSLPAGTTAQAGGRNVRIIVYDILGREVAVLVKEILKPGAYEVSWDGTSFAGGVYFYRITAGDHSQEKKMVLLK